MKEQIESKRGTKLYNMGKKYRDRGTKHACKRNKARMKEQIESKRGTKLQNMGNKNLETVELNISAKGTRRG
jgi:hypothetical protein